MKKRGSLKKVVLFGGLLVMALTVVLAAKSKEDTKACSYFKRVKISKCDFYLDTDTYAYTGMEVKPELLIVNEEDDKTLIEGEDYVVTYKNNVNPGKAKAVVKGINDYRGKKTVSYKIEKGTDKDVNIYVGNENADGFIVNPMLVSEITPENLIQELEIVGAVADGVQVLGFENNNGSLVLNLSQEFADDVSSSGTAGEYIKVGCVVNTFIDAYKANDINILVNGNTWESGHAVYGEEPLQKFD